MHYIATQLLGHSLEDLLNLCGGTFSVKTSLAIFYQLIERLEDMHSKNVLHGDIKPDNLLTGLAKSSNLIHIIDFGISRNLLDK